MEGDRRGLLGLRRNGRSRTSRDERRERKGGEVHSSHATPLLFQHASLSPRACPVKEFAATHGDTIPFDDGRRGF